MIIFRELTVRNFLSIGNTPITLKLNETQTTLIHGPNGVGKSTLLDALTYVLYNKSFRSCNLPQLVNSQNKKGMLVEVKFSIGAYEYIVQRGKSPGIFEIAINGTTRDAQASDVDNQKFLEDQILKLNYRAFTQIVILGTSTYMPFMQLPAAGRRDCVETFLDLKTFSVMSAMAKERLKGLGIQRTQYLIETKEVQYKITAQEEKIDLIKSRNSDSMSALEEKKSKLEDEKNELLVMMLEIENRILDLNAPRNIHDKSHAIRKGQKVLDKIQFQIDSEEDLMKYVLHNDDCDRCGTSLDLKKKDELISLANSRVDKKSSDLEKAQEMMKTILEQQEKYEERSSEVANLRYEYNTLKSDRDRVSNYLKEIQSQIDNQKSYEEDLHVEEAKMEVYEEDFRKVQEKDEKLKTEIDEVEHIVSLLKDDGVKAAIVRKYLPILNKYLSHYLKKLELPVHFTLDQQFNEVIHSPLHQDFSYSSFSEGQKSRIDLAMLFTWREVTRIKNSASTNLLILDEVFSSSLDEVGKDNLLRLLRFNLEDVNVFVVDHTLDDEFKEKFDRDVRVAMRNGFTYYC